MTPVGCRIYSAGVMSRTPGAGHVIEGLVDSHANEA
jgi:hypothetical protein